MSHGHILSLVPRQKKHKDDLKQRYKFFNIIKSLKKKQEVDWTYERHLKIIELEYKARGELGPISSKREIQKKIKKNKNRHRAL